VTVVVFLGPTLPHGVATQILPGATFLPPAGQGDVISALTNHEPEAIGLIDGIFGRSPAVWHKEILFALHHGVRVVGAASMGAIRAAELDTVGMEGVGEVYLRYRTGDLTDDDDVAVLHTDVDLGFKPLSLPMVNVRATVERACANGIIEARDAIAVINAAKDLHFPLRTVIDITSAADLPAHVVGQLTWH
jgi:hypothetical protein